MTHHLDPVEVEDVALREDEEEEEGAVQQEARVDETREGLEHAVTQKPPQNT